MAKTETKSASEESNRMWASASFVGVLIVVGLPLWWKTTEVYRVALPYEKINAFDTEPHVVASELTVLANDEPTAAEIAGHIEKAFAEFDVIKLIVHKQVMSKELQSKLQQMPDEEAATKEVAAVYDLEKHNMFYVVQKTLPQDVWVGEERLAFFNGAKGADTLAVALERWVYEPAVLAGACARAAGAARRARLAPHAEYHVTLSVARTKHAPEVDFDAEAAVEDYIGSFVDELSELHNFTLKSQWLHLLDFDFQAREIKDNPALGRHFAVAAERLPQLLTRLEERAAPHAAAAPAVNLALYVVPCHISPLVIYDNDVPVSAPVQAFSSPRWGGVVLGGAPECGPRWRPAPARIMGAFLAQLRPLLGITDKVPVSRARLAPLARAAPRRWEADALLRLRALEQRASARRSLRSLARLLGEISNIVINDEVGASINSAVASIAAAGGRLRAGDVRAAYRESQRAFLAAEAAFVDPSLLALLYFPDDQKYAIYIPLFLPIMVPVILSMKNLSLWFRGKPLHKDDKEKVD